MNSQYQLKLIGGSPHDDSIIYSLLHQWMPEQFRKPESINLCIFFEFQTTVTNIDDIMIKKYLSWNTTLHQGGICAHDQWGG